MIEKQSSGGLSKSDRKVLRIASSAAKLFSAKGYTETSMDDVAAAVKISKGGMYHYFNSKCDILNYILSTFMDFVLENVEQDLHEIADPAEKIRLFIFRHVKTYNEHMYLAKALLNEAHNLPAAKLKKIKSKERRYFAAINDAVSSYLGEGVDKSTLTVLTFNLLGMCNWIYSWYNPHGSTGPEELAQMIFNTFTKDLSTFQKDAQK
jgi:TetR/AcrR family transcriptional regulator, cholesterol catabolism regulator